METTYFNFSQLKPWQQMVTNPDGSVIKATKKKYLDYAIDGEKVPGVTSFLGIIDKPALPAWYYRMAMEGKNPRQETDRSAAYGSLVHGALDAVENGQSVPTAEPLRTTVENLLTVIKGWKLLGSEFRIFNRDLKYAGTVDRFYEIDGEPVLVDIKTSNNIYPENTLQLAAYKLGVPEKNPELIELFSKIERCLILHLDKDTNLWEWLDRTPRKEDNEMVGILRKGYDWVKANQNV